MYQVTSPPAPGIIIRSIDHNKGEHRGKSSKLTVLYTYPKVSMTVESLYIRTDMYWESCQNNSKASAVPTALKSGVNLAIKMRFWRSQRRPKKAVCSLFVSATPGQWSRGLSSQGLLAPARKYPMNGRGFQGALPYRYIGSHGHRIY